MISRISDFAPDGLRCGVGLAIEDGAGRFVLGVAGTRYRCPPGQRFLMGVGGHREDGETWLDCARREADEEIGADVRLRDARRTWHLSPDGRAEPVLLTDRPRPLALYEMVRPPGAPETGNYRVIVFLSSLRVPPAGLRLRPDEVAAVVALTPAHLVDCVERPRTVGDLLAAGARLLAESPVLDREVALLPLGTARALATLASAFAESPA